MNKVLEFLQEHPDYSFDEGVAVLLRYSANRGVNTFITVRRDRQHLRNELNRLAHIPNLRPLPGMEDVETKAAKAETVEPKSEESSQNEGSEATDDDDKELVTFLDLKHHKTYKPDELPTPMLKELWSKNRDEYKEAQHCHAMLKQANSDAGRADWRKQLLVHREAIARRWKLFDEEMERVKAEAATPAAAPKEKAYNPLNDRAYISKALKKAEWDDKAKLEVQHRVETLLKNGMHISEETAARLRKRGITL